MFKEELLSIVSGWTLEYLDDYIRQLETRIKDTRELLMIVSYKEKESWS